MGFIYLLSHTLKQSSTKGIVLYAPGISIITWKWSIHYPSLTAMFNLLHSSTNQEMFKKYLHNQSSHYEKYEWCRGAPQLMALHPSIIVWKVKYPLRLFVIYVQPVIHSITNQELFKKHLCSSVIKVASAKNKDSVMQRKPSCATFKSTLLISTHWHTHLTSTSTHTEVIQTMVITHLQRIGA